MWRSQSEIPNFRKILFHSDRSFDELQIPRRLIFLKSDCHLEGNSNIKSLTNLAKKKKNKTTKAVLKIKIKAKSVVHFLGYKNEMSSRTKKKKRNFFHVKQMRCPNLLNSSMSAVCNMYCFINTDAARVTVSAGKTGLDPFILF